MNPSKFYESNLLAENRAGLDRRAADYGLREACLTAPPPPPVVSVLQPVEREVVEWDEYIGRLESPESVEIRARVSGYLDKVHFKEGKEVKKGDLLFTIDRMLEFSARHSIAPVVETFPMSKVNDALEHLRAGKARYRIVLDADF